MSKLRFKRTWPSPEVWELVRESVGSDRQAILTFGFSICGDNYTMVEKLYGRTNLNWPRHIVFNKYKSSSMVKFSPGQTVVVAFTEPGMSWCDYAGKGELVDIDPKWEDDGYERHWTVKMLEGKNKNEEAIFPESSLHSLQP